MRPLTDYGRKLLTVITEAALEGTLIQTIEHLGAHGYTIVDARGKGARGVRDAGWEASGNIRIEIVCKSETAADIAAHLQEHYYNDYAMILFVNDVDVLRPEKF